MTEIEKDIDTDTVRRAKKADAENKRLRDVLEKIISVQTQTPDLMWWQHLAVIALKEKADE